MVMLTLFVEEEEREKARERDVEMGNEITTTLLHLSSSVHLGQMDYFVESSRLDRWTENEKAKQRVKRVSTCQDVALLQNRHPTLSAWRESGV